MRMLIAALLVATTLPLDRATAQAIITPARGSGLLWDAGSNHLGANAPTSGGILGDGSRDHRYTGMWTGLGIGATFTVLGLAFCSDTDTPCKPGQPWKGALIGIPVLAVTGALIGALFPKDPPQ